MKSLLLFRRRIIASIIIAVSIFLVVNQWRYAFIAHNRQDNRPPNQQTDEIEYQSHHQHQQQHQHQKRPAVVVNEIIHRAFFGLGHRLHRSAAAYHLAQSLSLSSSEEKQKQDQQIITHLRFQWESCLAVDKGNGNSNKNGSGNSNNNTKTASKASGTKEKNKEYNVFRYLFGEDLWTLNHDDSITSSLFYKNSKSRVDRRNMIIIRNDIPGYINGQLYKNLKIPIDRNSKKITVESSQFNRTKQTIDPPIGYNVILNKLMKSDVDFYRRLVNNYRFRSELYEFKYQHKWNERSLVVGLHLRAGNGEDGHFKESGRAASMKLNESVLVSRLVQLINLIIIRETNRLQKQHGQSNQNNTLPPLLFIATDTAHFLPLIEKAITNEEISLRPEIITYPQYRLPRNAGVGFDVLKGKGDSCLDGWKSAVNDALLLSEVDILIAAKYSTFTQSLPLALGFDRNRNDKNSSNRDDDHGHESKENITRINNRQFSFCEISEPDATSVTCVTDVRTWLFRGEDKTNGHIDSFQDDDYRTTEDARIWTVVLPTNTTVKKHQTQQQQQQQQVAHKVTVLLPDIVPPKEFEQAQDFLRRVNSDDDSPLSITNNTELREKIFLYGRSKIYRKYRNIHKETGASPSSKSNNSNWNLVYNSES